VVDGREGLDGSNNKKEEEGENEDRDGKSE